ncbi:MGDG synthase family glycosyltransferase [Polycladomyces subterraneus]|uniref:UDP-N-acetylglucosamine 2-epimerase n=1 Tax=Polycladomyces subterraneus TaxID=1016997 RepID=A0ABT8IQ63_9BACL|nr:glycosyltransferase [Polycladomyces subterraneus]MDN4594880.1 UDP-N-acetylglucosamine 2-epimerase [Polycladomyces subterraneus]
MTDKVLILTEQIGGNGHFKAAQAIQQGLAYAAPQLQTEIACGLPLVNPSLEQMVRKCYLHTLQYAPHLWGAAYRREGELSHWFKTPLGKVVAKRLKDWVEQVQPRAVVCTHALCLSAMGRIKERMKRPFALGAAITDFDVNGFWVDPTIDFYLVAHERVEQRLRQRFGISPSRIHVTGIPIDPAFSVQQPAKSELRHMLGLDGNRLTVLIMGGGVGLGPMEACLTSFCRDWPEVQLVVVTGKNESLFRRLNNRFGDADQVRVLGYVDRMAQWMNASDWIVSKPGGLTSSEALAAGLPLIICRPIPGQEERNTRFLLHQRVAVRQDSPSAIPRQMQSMQTDHTQWLRMRAKALQLGRPDSALRAADVILNTL